MNWGHKIALIYGLFMAFMIGMLFLSRKYDHELVTEDYYAEELAYQQKIDAGKNLAEADFQLEVKLVDGKLRLLFNELPSTTHLKGEVTLYKPDNRNLDETLPLVFEGGTHRMDIATAGKSGRYKVKVAFELEGKSFYKEKDLVL
jgi:hypothetical protein